MIRQHRVEVCLISLIVLVAAVGVRSIYQPLDPQSHIERVESLYEIKLGEPHPWFTAWSLGDGQAYAVIADDVSGRKLDNYIAESTYRFSRAGYGWLAAALSLGRDNLIPYGLALAGALSVLGVLWLTIRLRTRIGPRAWWIVLNPALYIGFAGDTSEALGILLLVAALGWNSWVSAMLLGVTRPTYLVACLGNRRVLWTGVAGAVALTTYSFFTFGPDSFKTVNKGLGLPFAAYVDDPSIWGILLALAATGTLIVGVKRRDWAWTVGGFFVLCFGAGVLADPVNAWRAAGFVPVLWAFGPAYDWVRESKRAAPLPVSA